MRYGVSLSNDFEEGKVVIRDFLSTPKGRILCIIARENRSEAEEIAQYIVDLLNNEEARVVK